MSAPEPMFLASLTEQERTHFRNLALIRTQLPTPGQLQVIEGLARSLGSKRLLTLIARTPHWLVHGPILQALAENESTPEAIRRDLEMAVSLFDLMYEMDRAPADEKEERSEMVKALYQQLPPDLKPVVKQQARQLARQVNATGLTQELPPLPAGDPDWDLLTEPPQVQEPLAPRIEASRAERLEKAASTHVPEELSLCLLDADAEVRAAALHNPMLSEELLDLSFQRCALPELLEEVYAEARWYFRDYLRDLIFEHPATPPDLARRLRVCRDLVSALERGASNRGELHRIAALFAQLDEGEYQYVTFWAKKKAPHLLRVIKIFYDRLQRRETIRTRGLGATEEPGRWASLEERVFMANQASQPEQLAQALRDPDAKVFTVVLENPGLGPRELLAAIPAMDQARAERLALHRAWGDLPAVQEALLHNVHLGEATALRLLARLDSSRALLDLLRDPRIPHLELKRQALERLRALYLGLSIQDRILALRSSGGEIIRHLPLETLKDEETLLQLVSDRQLDPSVLLRLARNKQTPRAVLERIASHPILMAHTAIMSELLLNPKTPREASTRIWGLLSEAEQQQLLRSPHLPTTLRHLA